MTYVKYKKETKSAKLEEDILNYEINYSYFEDKILKNNS